MTESRQVIFKACLNKVWILNLESWTFHYFFQNANARHRIKSSSSSSFVIHDARQKLTSYLPPSHHTANRQFVQPPHIRPPPSVLLKHRFYKKQSPYIHRRNKQLQERILARHRPIRTRVDVSRVKPTTRLNPKLSQFLSTHRRRVLLAKRNLRKPIKKGRDSTSSAVVHQSPYYALIPISPQKSHTRNRVGKVHTSKNTDSSQILYYRVVPVVSHLPSSNHLVI